MNKDTLPPLNLTIAGALFDFMGFLTSHETQWKFSSRDEANPAVEAIEQWAKAKGYSISDADVMGWQAALAAQAPQQAQGVAAGCIAVPAHVLKAASESLGSFVSDHGWGDADMQAMDNLNAYLAPPNVQAILAAPQAAPAPQALTDEQIANAVGPLYASDQAARLGLADDIRTVRAVLGIGASAGGEG